MTGFAYDLTFRIESPPLRDSRTCKDARDAVITVLNQCRPDFEESSKIINVLLKRRSRDSAL